MDKVMLYEVKNKAASNAEILLNEANSFFYWNALKFKKLAIGDIVFVVNKTGGYVLFTTLDKRGIDPNYSNVSDISTFIDEGKKYNVSGKWESFIRLKVLDKKETTSNWAWKSLGSPETTYFFKEEDDLTENNKVRTQNILEIYNEEGSQPNMILKQILDGTLKPTPRPKALQSNRISTKSLQPSNMILKVLTAIQTKPFILLAGISGTGKSRLVRTLAYKTCSNKELQKDKPANFELIPVRPNWHDSSELLGYVSRISGKPKYVATKLVRFLARAWEHTDIPFFLCLDEMNLAPVEQYFAEFLSIIETRKVVNGVITSDPILSKEDFTEVEVFETLLVDIDVKRGSENWTAFLEKGISMPPNLVIMGTVNMDETTHSFSRKVLDRAMTIEMNQVDLSAGLTATDDDWSYPSEFISADNVIGAYTSGADVYQNFKKDADKIIDYLNEVNMALANTPFKIAYRVRDEFLIYAYHKSQREKSTNWLNECLDEMTVMKILSRIEGDENRTSTVLAELQNIFDNRCPNALEKVKEMIHKLQSGYTSFWS